MNRFTIVLLQWTWACRICQATSSPTSRSRSPSPVIPRGRRPSLLASAIREGSHADLHRCMRPLRGANIGCADVLGFAFGMTGVLGAFEQCSVDQGWSVFRGLAGCLVG